MKAVQVVFEDDLLEELDQTMRHLGVSRSAYIRDLVKKDLKARRMKELERQQIEAYIRQPVKPGEFGIREEDRAWGDDWPWEDA